MTERNTAPPPKGAEFWELFDFLWVRGLGNDLHRDGTGQSWTAASMEIAFDGSPDKRSIENWQSRANMPSPDNLRKLSGLVSGGDDGLRKQWYEALLDARLEAKRQEKTQAPERNETPAVEPERSRMRRALIPLLLGGGSLCAYASGGGRLTGFQRRC